MRSFCRSIHLCRASAVLITSALVLMSASDARADPISFAFGIPSPMTLVQNQPVPIPAALINTGTTAIDFDALILGFGGGYAPSGPPVLPSGFDFGPETDRGESFLAQFRGLTLEPGDRLDFILGRLNVLGTPIGTVLRPRFSFQLNFPSGRLFAENSPVVTVGTVVTYGPMAFVANEPAPVPEPGTWLLVGSGIGYALRRRARRRVIE